MLAKSHKTSLQKSFCLYISNLAFKISNKKDRKTFKRQSTLTALIYQELESCVSEGLVRSIGVSNFNARQLQNILDHCSIIPVTNQCEIHLYLQNEKLREYCAERDVVMTAYTPLGKPFV